MMEKTGVAREPMLTGGQTIGGARYVVQKFLETKRGANLYRATDTATNLNVIVKEKPRLPEDVPSNHTVTLPVDEEWTAALDRNPWRDEFTILRSVSYPTVVKAVDTFREGDDCYLIVEQLEGSDLAYFMTKHPVTVQQSLDWLVQLCQSLSQLHRRGIVHLDLQPRYIVVTHDMQRVRLTGFDRARQLPAPGGFSEYTPGYSPPEQYGQERLAPDQRSDIYSLGIIWLSLLTGLKPVEHQQRHPRTPFIFPPVAELRPAIHPQINHLIARMTEPNPTQRFKSIDEVKQAVLEILARTPIMAGFSTHVGRVREGNEDSYYVQNVVAHTQSQSGQLGVFIVADGMGGVQAGEQASALAVKQTAEVVVSRLNHWNIDQADVDFQALLKESIKSANLKIHDTARQRPDLAGMGTTITVAIVRENFAYIGHVGDSRAYLINQHIVEKVTRDHSLVGRLLEIGQITPEEAAVYPQRNLIYRSLGTYPDVEVDFYQRPLRPGDSVLLCSDGLNNHVEDREIAEIVRAHVDPQIACQELINLANARGGEDNITVVVVRLEEIR